MYTRARKKHTPFDVNWYNREMVKEGIKMLISADETVKLNYIKPLLHRVAG